MKLYAKRKAARLAVETQAKPAPAKKPARHKAAKKS
jgi:hypothetical protein